MLLLSQKRDTLHVHVVSKTNIIGAANMKVIYDDLMCTSCTRIVARVRPAMAIDEIGE